MNAVEVFETFFASWLLGAVAVPLNYRLSGAEIRYMLEDSGAAVLVHSADTDALVASAAAPAGRAAPFLVAVRPASCPAGGLDYEAEIADGPASTRSRRSGWTIRL